MWNIQSISLTLICHWKCSISGVMFFPLQEPIFACPVIWQNPLVSAVYVKTAHYRWQALRWIVTHRLACGQTCAPVASLGKNRQLHGIIPYLFYPGIMCHIFVLPNVHQLLCHDYWRIYDISPRSIIIPMSRHSCFIVVLANLSREFEHVLHKGRKVLAARIAHAAHFGRMKYYGILPHGWNMAVSGLHWVKMSCIMR